MSDECYGHEWDEWDENLHRSVMQCQACHITMEDYVTKLEAENQQMREALTVIDDYFDSYIGHIPYNVAVAAKTAQEVNND